MRKAIDKTVKMNITEVKQLLEYIIENNLKSYNQDKFSQSVWVCKIK